MMFLRMIAAQDSDFLERMRRSIFDAMDDANIFIVILGLLLLAVLCAAVYSILISPLMRKKKGRDEMFHSLCAANGLSEEEAALLRKIARRAKTDPPAMAFVRPSLFDASGEEREAALKNKLFSVN